ncbi:MAG: hypothetical protein LBN41_03800 [Enterobacteriaceae bacterium]|nr:hypothetical protein [Enterobacteriaceae bacterium]
MSSSWASRAVQTAFEIAANNLVDDEIFFDELKKGIYNEQMKLTLHIDNKK